LRASHTSQRSAASPGMFQKLCRLGGWQSFGTVCRQHHKLAQIAIQLAVSQFVSRFVMLTLMPAVERRFGLFVFTKLSDSHEQAVFTQ